MNEEARRIIYTAGFRPSKEQVNEAAEVATCVNCNCPKMSTVYNAPNHWDIVCEACGIVFMGSNLHYGDCDQSREEHFND
jgi:hypothetical protein